MAYARAGGGERIALLPYAVPALLICAAVAVAVFWIVRRGASAAPLLLLSLVSLPWLPVDLPAALLLWSGRLSLLVWLALATCWLPEFLFGAARVPRPRLTAGALAFAIGAFSFWQVSPQLPGGDEPHYLVITQSLLKDGDLRIENNHRERHYDAYFAGELPPDFIARGRDREIYSIHAPGVPALVAPVFAVAGYGGTVVLLLIVSALGSALAWHLAWLVTGREDAAWFGWAAVTLSVTWIFHSFTVYPDGPGAVLVLTGVWALVRAEREKADRGESAAPWLWHGAALALLPWMHTRFAVLAGGLGALVLLRLAWVANPAAKAFAFLAVPAVSLIGWLAYFIGIYGTPNPTAPYGPRPEGGLEFIPDGLAGLLFDQRFGLLAYAPVLFVAFIGIGIMLARPAWRRYALEHLFVLVPYLIVTTHYPMWWGGRSAPARFFVALLPWMAVPAAAAWATMTRRASRVTAMAALLFTVFASAVLVIAGDGALAFNDRDAYALWLEWLNGSVDLARALPVWWRDDEVPLVRGIAVWTAAALVAWLVLRALERAGRLTRLASFCTVAALVYAAAGSLAAAVTWQAQHLPGRAPTAGQLDLLRRLSTEPRVLAVGLSPWQWMRREDATAAMRIAPPGSRIPGGAGRNDRPLYVVPAVPAGEYRLHPALRSTEGWIMVGIGRDQFAIATRQLTDARTLSVRFPVDVRALILRADEDARRAVTGLVIEPTRIVLPEARLSDSFARHAVRYGPSTVYFMDEASFPEPEAFWVGGSRSSEIVIQPDEPRAAATLLIRNGAVENTVLISSRGWREEMRLGPGEERRLEVPLDHAGGATLFRLRSSSGFRPSAVDPNSRDHRFLGVWIKPGV